MANGTDAEPAARGTLTPVLLGLVWLGASGYVAHTMITGGPADLAGWLADAAAARPGVVAAALVTAAAIAAAAGPRSRSAGGRLLAGLALGTALGLAGAAAVRFAYGAEPSVIVFAITVGAAGVAGGALAGLPGDVLRAGLWGTTWVFLGGVIFGVLSPGLVRLLGGGEPADARVLLGQSLVTGVVAAYSALRILGARRTPVPWHLVGGALPGLVLLGAAWLTGAGGQAIARWLYDAGSPALLERSDPARLRQALIVLAVGGLVALLGGALSGVRTWARRGPGGERGRQHGRAGVDAFHEGLARIGLDAGERYGFALAGGYAIQAAGFLKRPCEDVDLFTAWERRGEYETGARAIVDAYLAAGLRVQAERRHDTFTRLTISDGARTTKVELGVDSRANAPVRVRIGPVLHPDDAVANKMRAIYERAHACDFIDIDAALRSGRYDRSELMRLAERSDITFDRGVFADALARAQALDADDCARYGVIGDALDGLRHRFASWRAELLGAAAGPDR
jgi:hypothetical protein